MRKTILFASSNTTKIEEFRNAVNLISNNIDIITPDDVDIDMSDVDESGTTYASNSFIKAEAAYKLLHESQAANVIYPTTIDDIIVIADDSGYEIEQFHNMPGIYTHRLLEVYPVTNMDPELSMKALQVSAMTMICKAIVYDGTVSATTITNRVAGTIHPNNISVYRSNSYYMNYFAPEGFDKCFVDFSKDDIAILTARGKCILQLLTMLSE